MNKIMFVAHKFCAFTLAETLIVMGIIGVVAALTIPNLNSSTADKEKVAKLNKIYSNLNDAVGRAQAVYGPVEEWLSGKTAEQKKLNILWTNEWIYESSKNLCFKYCRVLY